MKLLLAALFVTFVIAVTASVFAIWPVVADAPWEDEAPTPVVVSEDTDAIRCEGALSLRGIAVEALGSRSDVFFAGYQNIEAELAKAEREIRTYC